VGLVKDAVLSGVAPKAVDLVKVVVKAVRVEVAKAVIKAKKYTMVNLHLCPPTPKALEMGLSAAHQKVENLLIKALESPEILAKASDF
jgi:hypothetical protein